MNSSIEEYLNEKSRHLEKDIESMCSSTKIRADMLKMQAEGLFHSVISELNSELYEYLIDQGKTTLEINEMEAYLEKEYKKRQMNLQLKNDIEIEEEALKKLEKKNIDYLDLKHSILTKSRTECGSFLFSNEESSAVRKKKINRYKEELIKVIQKQSRHIGEEIQLVDIDTDNIKEITNAKRQIRQNYLDLRSTVRKKVNRNHIRRMKSEILEQEKHLFRVYKEILTAALRTPVEKTKVDDKVVNVSGEAQDTEPLISIEKVEVTLSAGIHITLPDGMFEELIGEEGLKKVQHFFAGDN